MVDSLGERRERRGKDKMEKRSVDWATIAMEMVAVSYMNPHCATGNNVSACRLARAPRHLQCVEDDNERSLSSIIRLH